MSVADELVPCMNLSFDIINTRTGVAQNGFLRPIPMSHAEFMARWSQLPSSQLTSAVMGPAFAGTTPSADATGAPKMIHVFFVR